MNLSILEKISLVFGYFTSSFLGIEMFIVVLLLFLFSIFNIYKNNSLVKIFLPIFICAVLLFISGGFHTYVMESINSFIKSIMSYYYFPSMAFYYILIVVVSILFVFTILRDSVPKIKKIINYVFFSIIYLCFLGLVSYVVYEGIGLSLDFSIYQDDLILSFVQLSNLLLLFWIIVTIFWYLYLFFKKKFD